ncbi:MAG: hypothetical protein K2X87_05285 [Gemmataceae bacterium]|nr:hypothetical protein [Gemmataceae bacterium]
MRPAAVIDPLGHLDWSARIARGVSRHYRFGRRSQERADLEQVAALAVIRKAREFDPALVPEGGDPDGQFRGWAKPSVAGDCRREGRRLKNGGTYHTRREQGRPAVLVEITSDLGDPTGEPFDLPDHRAGADPDPGPSLILGWTPTAGGPDP